MTTFDTDTAIPGPLGHGYPNGKDNATPFDPDAAKARAEKVRAAAIDEQLAYVHTLENEIERLQGEVKDRQAELKEARKELARIGRA